MTPPTSTFAREVAADADTVYFCLDAPTTTAGPKSSRRCSARCSTPPESADAKLVVLENLDMYGPSAGPLRRDNPGQPDEREEPDPRRDVRRAPRRTPSAGEVRVVIGSSLRLRRPRRARLRPRRVRVRNPRSPASEPGPWDGPTPSTPTATSPTSAATSSSSAPATTPTARPGTSRTPRPAPPDTSSSTCTPRPDSAAPT